MNDQQYTWIEHSSPQELAAQLADDIVAKLNHAIEEKGSATIALSGGSTPEPMLHALSKHEVNWQKVVVTLVDERCVDDNHPLSNAKFIKTSFLDKLVQQPTFVPLYFPAQSDFKELSQKVLDRYCESTSSTVDAVTPFDVVVLGMGGDGHTASFFPDADNIDSLVDPSTSEYLLSCESATTQVPRITWSLRMLLDTQMLALHFTGETKKSVFAQAAQSGDVSQLPIRSAIFQDKAPLNVYYAD